MLYKDMLIDYKRKLLKTPETSNNIIPEKNEKNLYEEYNSENNRKNKFNKNKNGSKNTDNYSEDEFDIHFTENILNNKKRNTRR